MSSDRIDYPKASKQISDAGVIVYIGGVFLVIAFLSPYWIESYDEARMEFKHMGLWTYCFNHFRYPHYQFDKLFTGCGTVFSEEYYVIREWLLPGWLLFLELCMTLALLLSLGTLALIASILTRYPQRLVLKYEYMLSAACFLATSVSATLIFVSLILFPFNCWRRDWLQNPMFNHLSWSYYTAVLSGFIHVYGAWYLYKDARITYEQRRESKNLVMQMYPPHERNFYDQ
ncbi:PMP-22/EMP/MP20/Claudin superfamily [Cinara cedri]|uniref:PMP-22/EMP/MP20/Claudin superfamily n=1 Tax=Cinara cedri TaxID=506608 RepID=A0A5E4M7H4_9HEMI|nr:PMP-22/EMP/MP20/Claudin superfamily [Cinara cedri]